MPTTPIKAKSNGTDMDYESVNLILGKIGEMTEVIKSQQQELKSLRDEVKTLKKNANSNDSQQQLLEKFMKRSGQQLNDILKREAKARDDGGKLEQVVAQEMKKIPAMASQELAKTVSSMLESDVRQRTAKSEAALRDAVSRLAHPKQLPEQLAHCVAQSMAQRLQQELREAIANSLIPATERAMQKMLQQVSVKLSQGVAEHDSKMQAHLDKVRQEVHAGMLQETKQAVQRQMEQLSLSVQDVVSKEIKSVAASPANVPDNSPGSHKNNSGLVQTANYLQNGFISVKQCVTILPCRFNFKKSQDMIRGLLMAGQHDKAFELALSCNSLALVLDTCDSVNPAVIFTQDGCKLTQHVLLALVQQLGKVLFVGISWNG